MKLNWKELSSVCAEACRNCGVFLIITLLAAPAIADDYLDALNAEVSGSDYVAEAEQEAHMMKQDAQNVQVLGEIKVATQSKRNFEDLLLKRYPSTFQIYLKLDDTQKDSVFSKFKQSEKLNEASKLILQAYLK